MIRTPSLLSSQRPGLAFEYGYDWLAQRLHAAQGPAACVLHEAVHQSEMMSRIPSLPLLQKSRFAQSHVKVTLPALGWVMPQMGQPDTLHALRPWVKKGSYLHILAAGPFFPLLGMKTANKRPFLQANQLILAARPNGWRVREWIGLRGTQALTWQVMKTAVSLTGSASLQDRLRLRMQYSFAEHGVLRPFVALNCITLERIR